MQYSVFVALALALAVNARPTIFPRAAFTLKNGQDAIALNAKFATLNANSPCNAGDQACVNGQFAQCVGGKFTLQACAGGTICSALPLVNSAGTSIACTTADDAKARIAATGAVAGAAAAAPPAASAAAPPAASSAAAAAPPAASAAAAAPPAASAAAAAGGDPQASLTLDPAVISKGFANNGQAQPEAGQVASLTSTNNFINFCKLTLPGTPLTDGKQVTTGSCNVTPMGLIPSKDKQPSAKFVSPKNGDTLDANKPFTISMAISNLVTGNFVNAQENYFSAPQQLDSTGTIVGHSHVVVEQLTALDQITPTDPQKFAFFKGLNAKAVNGVLTADVTAGLPEGVYRLGSINTAANHQPAVGPVAQHGIFDDAVYFTVKAGGAAAAAAAPPAAGAAAAATPPAAAAAAGAKGAAAAPPAAAAAAPPAAAAAAASPAAAAGKGKN